jgi:hypothetical protein
MRCARPTSGHLAALTSAALSFFAWPTLASAQVAPAQPMQSGGLAPPPPMQSGGLAPPSKDSGPPPMAPARPNPTQLALEASQEQDSGRGLEFVYFQAEGGFQFASLDAITHSGSLVPDGNKTSLFGPLVGVTSGIRLLYFTLGPRFRFAHMSDWDLWTLNLDVGWHIPLGKLEPHGEIGAGFAKLGHSADAALGAARGVSVSGFDLRLGAGVDYYPTAVVSIGALLDVEFMRLARSSIAPQAGDPRETAAFGTSASTLGLSLSTCLVLGFHF